MPDLFAVLALCILNCTLSSAVTTVLRDRYWLRRQRAEKARSWSNGWDAGRFCGLQEGKRAAVLQRIEEERHAAP